MPPPAGLRTVQKFSKSIFDKTDVDAQAEQAKDAGATAAAITDDGAVYVLTVDWPPLDVGEASAGTGFGGTAFATATPATPAGPNHALDFAQAIVEHWEGCSLVVYHGKADRPDVWTIGWGTIQINGQPVTAATPPISQSDADGLLRLELIEAQKAVKRCIDVALTGYQEAGLISFTYNLGEGNLKSSTLRTLLNGGHVDEAAAEFPRWVMSNKKRVAGLIRRRGAEQAVFEGRVPFGTQLSAALDKFGDAALVKNPA